MPELHVAHLRAHDLDRASRRRRARVRLTPTMTAC